MSNNKENLILSWLHISDLHVFSEADTTFIIKDYEKLSKIISPQFIVVTGDFRHLKHKTDFVLARLYLESILKAFQLEKKDTFLVPGNHDVNNYNGRKKAIKEICLKNSDYSLYSKYPLYEGFSAYNTFVRDFYKDSGISDARITNPSNVYCILWNKKINILSINTALISDGENHEQIIDINELSKCYIDHNYPTIMIGHHSIDSLYLSHRSRLERIIDQHNISAYLHGDIHKNSNNPIKVINIPNKTIPSIACGKSAPQSGDMYSDVSVIYYEWSNNDNTYIQAYKWNEKGFLEDPVYIYEINKRFKFSMMYNHSEFELDLNEQLTMVSSIVLEISKKNIGQREQHISENDIYNAILKHSKHINVLETSTERIEVILKLLLLVFSGNEELSIEQNEQGYTIICSTDRLKNLKQIINLKVNEFIKEYSKTDCTSLSYAKWPITPKNKQVIFSEINESIERDYN